jgi:hypothetical protein
MVRSPVGLRWRRPAAIVNVRPISSGRILRKEYNSKYSVEKILVVGLKGLVAKTNLLAVNRQPRRAS